MIRRRKPIARMSKKMAALQRADKAWRQAVLKRWYNLCRLAGAGYCRGPIEAHHLCGKVGKLRHDIENGIALCEYHHRGHLSAHMTPALFRINLKALCPIAYGYMVAHGRKA